MQKTPALIFADKNGQIYDHPTLLMVCRRGEQWGLPKNDELLPMPAESELFLLPERTAVGFNPQTNSLEEVPDSFAVGVHPAPAHTISAHPCYQRQKNAPILPLFAYAAVGFANNHFYVTCTLVDNDPRQRFAKIPCQKIANQARHLLRQHPKNRLLAHIINNCVTRYNCPAARNFALGRFEAPLPTSRTCPAKCLGCISKQEQNSEIKTTPQSRLTFTPTAEEICEIMRIHSSRETKTPIYSFGQGCEGDPLTNSDLLVDSIGRFRQQGGHGTINCNTNGAYTETLPSLKRAGLTSLRISLNSARKELYTAYYRPIGYDFTDVRATLIRARELNLYTSLNLLFFPGLTDTEIELSALANLCTECGISMIQWRNLNIDPEWYYKLMCDHSPDEINPCMGLSMFMHRLHTLCPWLRFGYFNPYLGDHAEISAPMPKK
ncbi:MAG: radical SAM protein [Desulfovibrio sp.]|nr:radical SAM protein [Desulfovibrio sp.]